MVSRAAQRTTCYILFVTFRSITAIVVFVTKKLKKKTRIKTKLK